MLEPSHGIFRCDEISGEQDRFPQQGDCPRAEGAKGSLDLGPGGLDGIEARRVGRLVEHLGAAGLDAFAYAGGVVCSVHPVIHDDDVAWT